MSKHRVSVTHNSLLAAPNEIQTYLHCGRCLREKPVDKTPAEWANYSVGLSPKGIQVWCERHNCNVDHMTWEIGHGK